MTFRDTLRWLLLLVLGVISAQSATAQWTLPQTGCTIQYDYDDAGNRVARFWYCWVNNPPEELQVPIDTTAATEVLKTLDMKLAPNPAKGETRISFSEPIDAAIFNIYDSQGRSAQSGTLTGSGAILDISSLSPGLYNFCLQRGHEMLVKGLVVE